MNTCLWSNTLSQWGWFLTKISSLEMNLSLAITLTPIVFCKLKSRFGPKIFLEPGHRSHWIAVSTHIFPAVHAKIIMTPRAVYQHHSSEINISQR